MKPNPKWFLMGLVALMVLFLACQGDQPAVSPAGDDATATEGSATGRLETVKERGKLICASRNDVPGYGSLDASGNNVGFDIDLCRAVATAVLGDPRAIEIRFITAAERGPTIQSGGGIIASWQTILVYDTIAMRRACSDKWIQ